jgi:hypothetical protein
MIMNKWAGKGAAVFAATILASLLNPISHAVDPNCSPTSDLSTVPGFTILTFSTTGTCTWTPPSGVTSLDTLLVVGGGGGGAGAFTADNTSGGGGGGGGGVFLASSVSIPSSVTIQVGAGGTGGGFSASRGGNNGSRGSTSAFGTITAGGGGGGGCEATGLSEGVTCTTTSSYGGDGTAAGSGGGPSNYYNAYNPGGAGTASSATFNGNVFALQIGYRGGYYNQGGSSIGGAGGPGGGARGAANFNTRGIGLTSTITGSSAEYGRGGGAFGVASWSFTSSTPGFGTGGDGQRGSNAAGATGAQGVVIVKFGTIATLTTSIGAGNLNYRTVKAITATPNVSGKLTFRANNKVIPGCKNLASVANTARNCAYRASNRGNVSLTVTIVPTVVGISTVTAQIGSYFVHPRSGSR